MVPKGKRSARDGLKMALKMTARGQLELNYVGAVDLYSPSEQIERYTHTLTH